MKGKQNAYSLQQNKKFVLDKGYTLNRFARLVKMLLDCGRNEDLQKAVSDQGYREQLYVEAGLI